MIKVEFKQAMLAAGIEPPTDIVANGKIQRFTVDGDKKGSKNGWYVLFPDFPPAGAYGCWKRNIKMTFSPDIYQNHTQARIQHADRLDSLKRQINREGEKRVAIKLWEQSPSATNGCKYLLAKKVQSHGLRYYKNTILVPVMDCQGDIHGVQKIWPDGSKRFVSGTDKRNHFFLIGLVRENTSILIAEGYATAATLHEVTGLAVIVAFDSGNLKPVSYEIRAQFPLNQIVICGDDDHSVTDNPGRTKAGEAAEAIGALLAIPIFQGSRDDSDTDFNDLYRLQGAEAVNHCLRVAGLML